MKLEIREVLDIGDDVLLVRALNPNAATDDEQPSELEARGWVSATTNHYDAAAYDDDGQLKAGAEPRAMTAAEVGEYALRLINEHHSQPAETPAQVKFKQPRVR